MGEGPPFEVGCAGGPASEDSDSGGEVPPAELSPTQASGRSTFRDEPNAGGSDCGYSGVGQRSSRGDPFDPAYGPPGIWAYGTAASRNLPRAEGTQSE
jgi:hypothetical protein